MAKGNNNLAWRMRTKRERSSAGLVAKWGEKIAKRPDARGKLAGQYKLGISTVRANLTREREAKRRARLQELWGDHAKALDTLIAARERSRSMVRLVSTNDMRNELDAADRARRERVKVMLGDQWEATHVTYARCKLDSEGNVVKAYHRQPQFAGAIARSRWTNRRDVWACAQVA